jgi:hypothetical protein
MNVSKSHFIDAGVHTTPVTQPEAAATAPCGLIDLEDDPVLPYMSSLSQQPSISECPSELIVLHPSISNNNTSAPSGSFVHVYTWVKMIDLIHRRFSFATEVAKHCTNFR